MEQVKQKLNLKALQSKVDQSITSIVAVASAAHIYPFNEIEQAWVGGSAALHSYTLTCTAG
jgi:hypothetical protein